MKITDVKTTLLDFGDLPIAECNAILKRSSQKMIMVEVFTDEGLTGVSISGASRKNILMIIPYCEGPLKEVVCGEDPFDVEKIWHKMYTWRKPVAKGDLFYAVSSIDIALWDIIGKAVGKPVWKILGGFSDKVQAYAEMPAAHYMEGLGLKELAEDMRKGVSMGYRTLKMKVGRGSLKEEKERVRVAREAIGDDIALLLDANTTFTSSEAKRFINTMEQFNPYWLEEPVKPDDIKGLQEVRASTWVSIAAGENEFTRWGYKELIENRAVDIVNIDPNIAGGFTESRKIAAMADSQHIYVSPHGTPHIHVHLVAAVPNGLFTEFHPQATYFDDLAGFSFELKDGYIDAPQKPGLGFEIDKKLIAKYKI